MRCTWEKPELLGELVIGVNHTEVDALPCIPRCHLAKRMWSGRDMNSPSHACDGNPTVPKRRGQAR